MTPRIRNTLARALLALVLVFAQQVGVAHAATHVGSHGSDHGHGKGLKTQACDDCLSFAQAQGAGAGAATPALAIAALARQTGLPAVQPRPAPRAPFHSRAPPALPAR